MASAGLRDHIYFGNKRGWTGGQLDVDMNAGGPRTREAVENVVWMRRAAERRLQGRGEQLLQARDQ